MKKILTSLTVAVILLFAVGITTVQAGDTLMADYGAQPQLPASVAIGSFSASNRYEASRYQTNPFTWADLLKLLNGKNNVSIHYETYQKLSMQIECHAYVRIPKETSLEKIAGISKQQLLQLGDFAIATVDVTLYTFTVPMEYCQGGGGGGMAPQHAVNYIWLLLLFAILAMIAAAILSGGKLIPIPTK